LDEYPNGEYAKHNSKYEYHTPTLPRRMNKSNMKLTITPELLAALAYLKDLKPRWDKIDRYLRYKKGKYV
jgi:hypothetical protein